jgi:hypothetical protein
MEHGKVTTVEYKDGIVYCNVRPMRTTSEYTALPVLKPGSGFIQVPEVGQQVMIQELDDGTRFISNVLTKEKNTPDSLAEGDLSIQLDSKTLMNFLENKNKNYDLQIGASGELQIEQDGDSQIYFEKNSDGDYDLHLDASGDVLTHGELFTPYHSDLLDVNSDDHHSRFTGSEAVSALENQSEVNLEALTVGGTSIPTPGYSDEEAITAVESGLSKFQNTITFPKDLIFENDTSQINFFTGNSPISLRKFAQQADGPYIEEWYDGNDFHTIKAISSGIEIDGESVKTGSSTLLDANLSSEQSGVEGGSYINVFEIVNKNNNIKIISSNNVEIKNSGDYKINVDVTFDGSSTSNKSLMYIVLEHSGNKLSNRTKSYCTVSSGSLSKSSCSFSLIKNIAQNDYIAVHTEEEAGGVSNQTVTSASINVEKI